jgi:hypothetical protein
MRESALASVVQCASPRRDDTMFIALAVILGIAWLLGFTVFHVASAAIHVLVVLAIASVIFHFVRGRGTSSV